MDPVIFLPSDETELEPQVTTVSTTPKEEHILRQALRHPMLWSGVGMMIRGGSVWNLPLGLAFFAYGMYDFDKKRKGKKGKL